MLAISILNNIPYKIDLTSIVLHTILKLYICLIRKRYIAMGKVILEGFQCERCKHIWVPRTTTEGEPTICPKCKSPYWNKPRRFVNTQTTMSNGGFVDRE